jgi:hypothetical protein
VVPGSQAQIAGLEVGDTIKTINMYSDPEIKANMTVVRNGEELQFDFYPYRLTNIPTLLSSEDNLALLAKADGGV